MAKFEDLSLHHSPPVKRCEGGCANAFQKSVERVAQIALVVLISSISVVSDVGADAWLDRVERSLRRIESASKYTEPAGAGSKLATKTHHACIHTGDKDACEKLIWRSPELLPVRDWAVGTAHIKRGEMREQSGDVSGAVEDYRDALGYHQFSNLSARIKRLELLQKRDNQNAAKKAIKTKVGQVESQAQSAKLKNKTGKPKSGHEPTSNSASQNEVTPRPGHPIVVVAGWAATVAEKDTKAASNPTAEKPVSGEVPATQSALSTDQGDRQPKSGTAQIEVGSITPPPAPAPVVPAPPVPVRISSVRPSKNPSVAARFIPGHEVLREATTVSNFAHGAATSDTPAARASDQHSDRLERPLHGEQAKPDKIQFNVNAEVARSLERVRSKTDAVLTTSSLPDRGDYRKHAQQRSLMSLAVMAMLTLMTLSTVAVARGWRPSFPTGLPRPERNSVLSVDDLERLIKNRTAEALATELQPQSRRSPKIGSVARLDANPVRRVDTGVANADLPKSVTRRSSTDENATEAFDTEFANGTSQAVREGQSEPLKVTAVDGALEVAKPQQVSGTMPGQAHQSAGHDINFDVVESSLLRRVSYGAASLIVVAGRSASSCSEDLIPKVDAVRRPELLGRCHIWDAAQSEASGVLNPFALGVGSKDDPLAARQRFNAAFEFHNSIFESIFGARFVYDQKVVLRHLVMVLQVLPNSSLKTLYTILEAPRSLEPLREALAEIDNVAARLFFTTVFSSEEFSDKADYMRARLAPVVEHELVAHLCCGTPSSQPFEELSKDGRWILLGLDPNQVSPVQHAVVVRSLLSVMAMYNFGERTVNTGEIAASVFLPNLAKQIGGSATDTDFLLSEVKRAGYNVL